MAFYFNPRSSCEERLARRNFKGLSPISIHAPHARSDRHAALLRDHRGISIHAPHARSDPFFMRGLPFFKFQSTLLMRGATQQQAKLVSIGCISIHAPHARSDIRHRIEAERTVDFNPRSSCEERRDEKQLVVIVIRISIHAPHARSDSRHDARIIISGISIHAPHARSDAIG